MSKLNVETQSFGNYLKILRKSKDITQVKISEDAGVSKSYISFLESGIRHPSREVVLKLASILSLNEEQLDAFLMSANYAPLLGVDNVERIESEPQRTPDSFRCFEDFMQFVMKHIRSRKESEARIYIEQGFKFYDKPAQMQTLLAHLELSRKNFSHAILSQETALKYAELLDSKSKSFSTDYFLNLGVMYFLWGDQCLFEEKTAKKAIHHYRKALSTFELGLKKSPQHLYLLDEAARVHFNLADLLPEKASEHWKEVKRYFRQVLSHIEAPEFKENHRLESAAFLGLAYAKTGAFEEAELVLDTLKIRNNNWLVLYIQACHYCLRYKAEQKKSDLDLALSYFEQAAQKNSEAIIQGIEDQHKDLQPLKKNKLFQQYLNKEQNLS